MNYQQSFETTDYSRYYLKCWCGKHVTDMCGNDNKEMYLKDKDRLDKQQ